VDKNIIGAIEIKPTVRPEIPKLMKQLKQQGIKHLMIVSGDQQQPTQQLAQ
jgi:Cu2+-exporting ATPase